MTLYKVQTCLFSCFGLLEMPIVGFEYKGKCKEMGETLKTKKIFKKKKDCSLDTDRSCMYRICL